MRIWFSTGLFALSVLYFVYGMQTLTLLTSTGRPGPGFFPAIVGFGLVLFTALNIYKDYKARKSHAGIKRETLVSKQLNELGDHSGATTEESSENELHNKTYGKDVVWLLSLLALFIALLIPLGAVASMVIFMLILLWKFNPGQMKFNTLYSVLFPLGVYLLFEVWLRAGLPQGIFGF